MKLITLHLGRGEDTKILVFKTDDADLETARGHLLLSYWDAILHVVENMTLEDAELPAVEFSFAALTSHEKFAEYMDKCGFELVEAPVVYGGDHKYHCHIYRDSDGVPEGHLTLENRRIHPKNPKHCAVRRAFDKRVKELKALAVRDRITKLNAQLKDLEDDTK